MYLMAAQTSCLNTYSHQTHPCVFCSEISNLTNQNEVHMLSWKFRITGEKVGGSYSHHIGLIDIALSHGCV